MTPARWTAVDRALAELFAPADPALEDALAAAAAAGLPPDGVTPLEGKLLHLLARSGGARRILELGTLAGHSTIWLARALPPEGRLVTVEVDAERAEVARRNLARAGVAELVDVRVGPALDVLGALEREGAGPFDLVFLDADKERSPEYLRGALALAAPGTLLVADNVVRAGAVADPADGDAPARGVRRLLELLAAEPGIEATVLQTVGAKGWDGFALALVTDG